MTLCNCSSSDDIRVFWIDINPKFCESDSYCLSLLHIISSTHDDDILLCIFQIRITKWEIDESSDIIIVTEFIHTSVLRDQDRSTTEEVTTWIVEIRSWSALANTSTLIIEWKYLDTFSFDWSIPISHFCHIRETEITVEVVHDSRENITDSSGTCQGIRTQNFFFECFDEQLLADRSIEITGWVATSSIFERRLSIHDLESLLDMENLIPIVLVGVLWIDEFLRNIDLNTTESIDNLLESWEVDHNIVVNWLTGDFTDFIRKVFDTDFITFPKFIETVDTTSSFPLWIGDVEVSWDWEEIDTFLITIEWCEHDWISEITSFMSASTDSSDENIRCSFLFHRQKVSLNNRSKAPILCIFSSDIHGESDRKQ